MSLKKSQFQFACRSSSQLCYAYVVEFAFYIEWQQQEGYITAEECLYSFSITHWKHFLLCWKKTKMRYLTEEDKYEVRRKRV